jgi:chitinase
MQPAQRFRVWSFVLLVTLVGLAISTLGTSPRVSLSASPKRTPTPTAGPTPQPTPTPAPPSFGGRRSVGYFVQWGIYRRNYLVKNIVTSGSATKLTHINYAFPDISDTLACASGDTFADYDKAFDASESVDGVADPTTAGTLRGNFNQLRKPKLMYPHLKVVISIGGWTWSDKFSDAALPANRAAFVSSCIDRYIKGNFAPGIVDPTVFDGIDIDWEYPGVCGSTCNYRPEDTQNFTAILRTLTSRSIGKKIASWKKRSLDLSPF